MSFFRKLKDQIRRLLGKAPKNPIPAPLVPPVVPVVPTPVAPPTVGSPIVPPSLPPTETTTPNPVLPPEAPPREVGKSYQVVWNTQFFAYPIAKDWIPSYELTFMYGLHQGPTIVGNEDVIASPSGARSSLGYPMWNGFIKFDGKDFVSEQELAEYKARIVDRSRQGAAWNAKFDSVRYHGPVSAVGLSDNNCAYLDFNKFKVTGDLFRLVLEGSQRDINEVINRGSHLNGHHDLGMVSPHLRKAVEAEIERTLRGDPPKYSVTYGN